jgi:DNA-binding response OmpR family regulator
MVPIQIREPAVKSILVVEDDVDIAETLAIILRQEGHRVLLAENGEQGLASLDHRKPDLVLLDIMMPVMDGKEFCRRMRARSGFERVPIITMSAAVGLEREDCDWIAFVRKPFELETLLLHVNQVLGIAPRRGPARRGGAKAPDAGRK